MSWLGPRGAAAGEGTPTNAATRRRTTTRRVASALAVALLAIALVQTVGWSDRAATVSACDAVDIPSLALSRCVVEGDQPEIDAGHVVRVGYLSSDRVHWLAGHRSSHGSTFASLPNLRVGSLVHYRGQIFVVTDYRLVDRFRPDEVMSWMSSETASVVLQTSATGPFVHVWRSVALVPAAPIVAVAPPPVP